MGHPSGVGGLLDVWKTHISDVRSEVGSGVRIEDTQSIFLQLRRKN